MLRNCKWFVKVLLFLKTVYSQKKQLLLKIVWLFLESNITCTQRRSLFSNWALCLVCAAKTQRAFPWPRYLEFPLLLHGWEILILQDSSPVKRVFQLKMSCFMTFSPPFSALNVTILLLFHWPTGRLLGRYCIVFVTYHPISAFATCWITIEQISCGLTHCGKS